MTLSIDGQNITLAPAPVPTVSTVAPGRRSVVPGIGSGKSTQPYSINRRSLPNRNATTNAPLSPGGHASVDPNHPPPLQGGAEQSATRKRRRRPHRPLARRSALDNVNDIAPIPQPNLATTPPSPRATNLQQCTGRAPVSPRQCRRHRLRQTRKRTCPGVDAGRLRALRAVMSIAGILSPPSTASPPTTNPQTHLSPESTKVDFVHSEP